MKHLQRTECGATTDFIAKHEEHIGGVNNNHIIWKETCFES